MNSMSLCSAIVAAFAGASSLAQNMLTNPGFEEGPANVDPFLPLNAGSTAMPGWIVTRGQIDIVGNAWQQLNGSRSLDLNGSPGSGGVAQTIPTTIDRDYLISFFVAGNGGSAPAIKLLWVTAGGQTAGVQFDNTGTSYTDMHWTQYIYGFRAVATSTTIEFYSGTPSSFGGPALDNVVVRPADCRADLNYDGVVDDSDFEQFVVGYNQLICPGGFPGCRGDLNFDGFVDDADFVLFASAYNQLICP